MNIYYITIGVAVLFVLWVVFAYNRFVALMNQAKEAWADIAVQLKRRYDLIPNLVATVKGYAAHESGAFEKVSAARAAAIGAGNVEEKAKAETVLTASLKSVFAIAEAYPELKANQNFLALQEELSDTENKIQASRRFYNTTVRDLNTAIGSFPGNALAGIFKFETLGFFELGEADAEAKEPMKINF